MAETSAYLVDNVIPQVPVSLWVLSFPIPLRSLFAIHSVLLTPVLRILHRVIHTHLIQQTGVKRDEAASGSTHIVLTPMEFMQRQAALVPRPRLHLIRFHGVLAPNAKLRSQVVLASRTR